MHQITENVDESDSLLLSFLEIPSTRFSDECMTGTDNISNSVDNAVLRESRVRVINSMQAGIAVTNL
jgi:hypothetical protein